FYDDVVRYNAGGAAWTYPISGMGFSALLLWLGAIPYRQADFPFAAIEIAVATPFAFYMLRRLWDRPTIALMLGGYGLTLLAVGVFDGVHLGHQALIRRLVGDARAAGATPVAATFDPLPAQVLAQDPPQSTLADAPERATLLEHAGARDVVIFTFDTAFSHQ